MAVFYDKKTAQLRLENYCAYQERSQQEVRDKLNKMGILREEVEDIIAYLIAENFLNEERFAIAFAGGKFRIKQWGKLKIKSALKMKNTSDYCIKKALSLIENKEYLQTIQKIINKKRKEIIEKDPFLKNNKIANYLINKGFETELVWEMILAK